MKKIIQLIDNKISDYLVNIKKIKNGIKDIQCFKGTFELVKIDPDSANYDVIAQALDDQYKEDIEYILKFKGWMEEYQNEEQVKIAIEKLYKLLDIIEAELDDKINNLKCELNNIEKKYNDYKSLKSKLSLYSKSTYIEENEFNIICSFLNLLNEEEAIEILHKIGKTNAFIELERKGEIELLESLKGEIDLNTLDEMSKTRNFDEIIEDEYCYKTLLGKIDVSLKQLENIDVSYSIKKYIEETFEIINTFEDKIDNQKIEEADLFKDDLESIDEYLTYSLAIALLLVDAIEEKDEEKINELYAIHSNSIYYKKVTKEEKGLIEDYKNSLIDIFNEYYDDDLYNKFIHSYFSINEAELSNYVDVEQIQSIKIMRIINLNKDQLDKMSLQELNNLLNEINKEIKIYKDMLSKEEKEEETELNGLDINDITNFIVIRDTNKILNDIDMITSEHTDIIPSVFTRALNRIYMMSSNDLFSRSSCKPIMHESNVYDIREDRAGCIRILFRPFYTKDGRVFYEVLSFAYGSVGPKKKTENLIQSVKEYSDYKAEYELIEKNFKDRNTDIMSKYITEGLSLYNELLAEQNEKKKGYGLND